MVRIQPSVAMVTLTFLAFGLLSNHTLAAVSPDEIESAKTACDQDVQSFCAGVDAGGGRLIKCLVQHQDDLQSECRTALDDLRAAQRAEAAKHPGPCVQDVKSFCSGVARGEGRIAACLKQHIDHLQPGCRENMSKAKP